ASAVLASATTALTALAALAEVTSVVAGSGIALRSAEVAALWRAAEISAGTSETAGTAIETGRCAAGRVAGERPVGFLLVRFVAQHFFDGQEAVAVAVHF